MVFHVYSLIIPRPQIPAYHIKIQKILNYNKTLQIKLADIRILLMKKQLKSHKKFIRGNIEGVQFIMNRFE